MQRNMQRVAVMVLLVAGLIAHGCRRATPVDEISVTESGVKLQPSPIDLSHAWPAWRGGQGDGHVLDQTLPVTWSESEGVRWRADIPGRGHGSPVIVDDLVLLPTADDAQQIQSVIAYDAQTGAVRWSTDVHVGGFPSPRELHAKGSNANGTLACDGERVYAAFFNSGKIFATALDLSGHQVWQVELGNFDSQFGYAPSPVLYQSFVIFTADHRGGGYMMALDGESGRIAWRIARPAVTSHSSPMVTTLNGRDRLLLCGCDRVACYDPATGERVWSTSCLTAATCGTMVTDGTHVFGSGGYPKKGVTCLTADGEIVWSDSTKIYEPSMIVANGHLFAVNDDGIAYCWDANTGEVKWRKRLGGNFSASPILCNDLLYVSDLSGKTYVFQATGDGYQERAVNQLGDDCYASPGVAGGCLFLRVGVEAGSDRTEHLFCLETQPLLEE